MSPSVFKGFYWDFFFGQFRKVKKCFLGKEELVLRVSLLSRKIIRATICWTPDMCYILLQSSPRPVEQVLQWSHTWIAEAHLVPGQTADAVQWGLQTPSAWWSHNAFSWPHCLIGSPARISDFPAPWQLSNQNSEPGTPCSRTWPVHRGQWIWIIGRLLMSFSPKLIKSWLKL